MTFFRKEGKQYRHSLTNYHQKLRKTFWKRWQHFWTRNNWAM